MKKFSKIKAMLSAVVLSMTVSAPSFATAITGVYTCKDGVIVKLDNGGKLAFNVNGVGEFGVDIMLKTALSLMETKNDTITYLSVGSTYICNTSASFVYEIGSK